MQTMTRKTNYIEKYGTISLKGIGENVLTQVSLETRGICKVKVKGITHKLCALVSEAISLTGEWVLTLLYMCTGTIK